MTTQAISVTLLSDTVYVSGTVNGVATIWTMIGNDVWQTRAQRAEDETYRIELSIVSSSGKTTPAQFTLHYGLLSLITDRTQADVDRVRRLTAQGWELMSASERSEWLLGMKGAYNATDLNRVGNAVNYIANRLSQYGVNVTVNAKVDWTMQDIPTIAQMDTYLDNVAVLRDALNASALTPPLPDDMQGLTYIEANNIEQILLDINALITNMVSAWIYCGMMYCGGGLITNAE